MTRHNNDSIQHSGLREDVIRMFQESTGVFALALEDLSSGKQLLINERELFHAASTMKTPVMIEVYHQAREGRFSLEDGILVRNEFRSIVDGSTFALDPKDDSEHELYGRAGTNVSVRELVRLMITQSSNLATNILIDRVRAPRVMETMRALGADSIRILRGVEDQKAFDLGMNNMVNAYDLLLVFRALAKGVIVDTAACRQMMETLESQRFHEMIPGLLPPGTRVAHKTGSIAGVQHDSGIVFLPDGNTYVLVVLSKGLKSNKEGIDVIARVSRKIYDSIKGAE